MPCPPNFRRDGPCYEASWASHLRPLPAHSRARLYKAYSAAQTPHRASGDISGARSRTSARGTEEIRKTVTVHTRHKQHISGPYAGDCNCKRHRRRSGGRVECGRDARRATDHRCELDPAGEMCMLRPEAGCCEHAQLSLKLRLALHQVNFALSTCCTMMGSV